MRAATKKSGQDEQDERDQQDKGSTAKGGCGVAFFCARTTKILLWKLQLKLKLKLKLELELELEHCDGEWFGQSLTTHPPSSSC